METFTVSGRQFRNAADYEAAKKDAAYIEALKQRYDLSSREETGRFLQDIRSGKYRFRTILGKDLEEELEELFRKLEKEAAQGAKGKRPRALRRRKDPGRMCPGLA